MSNVITNQLRTLITQMVGKDGPYLFIPTGMFPDIAGRDSIRKHLKKLALEGFIERIAIQDMPPEIRHSCEDQARELWEDGRIRDCLYYVTDANGAAVIAPSNEEVFPKEPQTITVFDALQEIRELSQRITELNSFIASELSTQQVALENTDQLKRRALSALEDVFTSSSENSTEYRESIVGEFDFSAGSR